MGLYRPESFDEFKGNKNLVELLRTRIVRGDFPQAVLISGDEGVGKTTLVKLLAAGLNCENSVTKPCGVCKSCVEITERVIRQNLDTTNVKTFRMSAEGGVDTAKKIREYLNTNMMTRGSRVIDLEECHRMREDAQDVLLSDIEYLPPNVYVIASTTDLSGLQKTFLSRFVPINLARPTTAELVDLLEREAFRRKLVVQGGTATYEMIALWAENKPRAALKALEVFGTNGDVTVADVKHFVSYLDTKTVVPLVASLKGSVTQGIKAIQDLPLDINSHNSLLQLLIECVKLSKHQKFTKLTPEDARMLREVVQGVDSQVLLRFLYEIADIRRFNTQHLIAAFLRVHPDLERLETSDPSLLREEQRERSNNSEIAMTTEAPKAPNLSDLISRATIVDD